MLNSLFLLPLSVIPMIAPLTAPSGEITPAAQVQVAELPLPELSRQQWNMLRQLQGADSKPLQLEVNLAVDHGQVYDETSAAARVIQILTRPLSIGSKQSGKLLRGL